MDNFLVPLKMSGKSCVRELLFELIKAKCLSNVSQLVAMPLKRVGPSKSNHAKEQRTSEEITV